MTAVPLGLVALAVMLGLPPLIRWRGGPMLLAGAAGLAFVLGHWVPAPVVVLGPVAFLADGPALVALAAGALAAHNLPRQLLFFLALATLGADVRLFLLALLGLAAALPAGRRRDLLVALPLLGLIGLLFAGTGFALDLPGTARGVVQLRALGAAAVFLLAVLGLPAGARPVGLGLWLFGFTRFALPLWPEAGATLAPILAWVAGGGALVGAAASWLRPGLAALPLLGIGLLGALTTTSPGLSGAVLLAAALALWPALAAALLALAGAALALHAGWWAVPAHTGPTLLAAGSLVVAAIPWIRKAISQGSPVARTWLPLGLAAALALPPLTGLPLPGAHATAARAARRSLTADDVGGWRRLTRARRAPEPRDAGVD